MPAIRRIVLPFLTSVFFINGCDSLIGTVCTDEAVSGLAVQVRDSLTGLPAGFGATVTARDGTYSETLEFAGIIDSTTFFGAFERPGRYTIDVTRAGYTPWQRSNVVVASGRCHVIPVTVQAKLQPLP
jgi:hypothetical protein